MRIAVLALLLVASCASTHTCKIEVRPGVLVSPDVAGEPLTLTSERNGKRTRDALVYVEVTLENTGAEFLTVQARGLTPGVGMPEPTLVSGRELAAWIENELNRDAAASRSSVSFGFGGFGFGGRGGGVGMGVGMSTGGRQSAPADASAAREAARRGEAYPNDHLFAGEITLAPHAEIKRWFLLHFESEKDAKRDETVNVDVVISARGSDRERRYVLGF